MEFEDPQAALSAIRNMNEYELNGRRLRVNFSNSSHLEALAEKLGMDLTANKNTSGQKSKAADKSQGTQAAADALKNFSKAEMYDVIKQFKEISERDPDEARRLISSHPQLPEALLFLMSKLEMIQTPLPTTTASAAPSLSVATAPTTTAVRPSDPRAAAAPPRMDPRQQQQPAPPRMDPRQQQQQQQQQQPPRTDPRAASRMPQYAQQPPPQMQPPPGVAHLDPGLVQQVMSITPQQLAQLPPDKQQSIIQLRQQITNSR